MCCSSHLSPPAIQLNGMVHQHRVARVVHVDPPRVVLQTSRVNVGRHGAARVDLRHDLVVPMGSSKLGQCNHWVIFDGITLIGVVVAVHASVDGRALHVDGLVLLAGHVGKTAVLVDPSIGSISITSCVREATLS
jgi:hypothetical protein